MGEVELFVLNKRFQFISEPLIPLLNPHMWMSGRAGKDAGSPKDTDKDHDGTRNDIGPNGGRNYIPNGRTTTNPFPSVLLSPLKLFQ